MWSTFTFDRELLHRCVNNSTKLLYKVHTEFIANRTNGKVNDGISRYLFKCLYHLRTYTRRRGQGRTRSDFVGYENYTWRRKGVTQELYYNDVFYYHPVYVPCTHYDSPLSFHLRFVATVRFVSGSRILTTKWIHLNKVWYSLRNERVVTSTLRCGNEIAMTNFR